MKTPCDCSRYILSLFLSAVCLIGCSLPVQESQITTEEDSKRIAEGLVPYTLLNEDGLHYTSTGYAVMAEMFYEKLDELGYFDELKALAG